MHRRRQGSVRSMLLGRLKRATEHAVRPLKLVPCSYVSHGDAIIDQHVA